MNVALGGVEEAGNIDIKVKSDSHFRQFLVDYTKDVDCLGGDPRFCQLLQDDIGSDQSYANFQAWQSSTNRTLPVLVNVKLDAISLIMAAASDAGLKKRSDEFENAFNYIARNPRTHRTLVSMDVDTDWAEFRLLTPSAWIEHVPNGVVSDGARITNSSVRWDVPEGQPWQARVE